MIRRFNFTGRRKLPHSIFEIWLEPGPSRRFMANVDLSQYDFPPEARLYFEASSSGSGIVLRFPWGTVAKPLPPPDPDRSLEDLPGDNATFTFKVVDESQDIGRILGIARGLSLTRGSADSRAGERRESLLPVNPVAMSQEVWRVSYREDTPWLEVNANIENIMNRVQGDPAFVSLVFPAVMREVLTEALIIRGIYDVEETDRWESRWLSFGQRFHPEQIPPPEEDDADTRREWIDQVVRGFCEHHSLKDAFVSTPVSVAGAA